MMHKITAARSPKLSSVADHDGAGQEITPASDANDSLRVMRSLATDPNIVVLHGTLLALVRRDGRDLTARQLTAFLSVYMEELTHTVSSLAELLHISRPGVTRIMDRLVQFDLVAREEDREDRRRVLVRRTVRGAAFFRELVGISRVVAADNKDGKPAFA
jgi:DNA-binding MarR family transcriptional regulator